MANIGLDLYDETDYVLGLGSTPVVLPPPEKDEEYELDIGEPSVRPLSVDETINLPYEDNISDDTISSVPSITTTTNYLDQVSIPEYTEDSILGSVQPKIPDTQSTQVSDQLWAPWRQAKSTVDQIDGALDTLAMRRLQLAEEYNIADPIRQTQIEAEVQALDQQAQGLGAVRNEAQTKADVEFSGVMARKKSEYDQFALNASEQALSEIQKYNQEANIRREEERRRKESARADADERRKKYSEVLKNQEKDNVMNASALASIIGEFWLAYAENRTPDYATKLSQILQMANQRFDREIRSNIAQIDEAEGRVTAAASNIAEIDADRRAFELASLQDLNSRLQLEELKSRGTPTEAAVAQARRATEQEIQAKQIESQMAAEKARQAKEMHDLDVQKKKAEISKIKGDTKRLGVGSGSSKRTITDPTLEEMDPKVRAEIEQKGVRDPFSGGWLRTVDKDGNETGYYKAKSADLATQLSLQGGAARDLVIISSDLSKLIKNNGMEFSKWSSDAQKQMNSLFADALLIAKESEKTGALDDGSVSVLTDKLSGGVKPGEFGSNANIVIQSAGRSVGRFQRKLRDMGVSGNPQKLDYAEYNPDVLLGEIEKTSKAAGQSIDDHTGKPSDIDLLGEADSMDKYATSIRGAINRSKSAIQTAKTGMAAPLRGPYDVDRRSLNSKLQELSKKIDEGDTSTSTRDAFESAAKKAGLLREKDQFIFPGDADANQKQAQDNEMRADAARVASYMLLNNLDPRRVNLSALKKSGVIKSEWTDTSQLTKYIGEYYRKYGAK